MKKNLKIFSIIIATAFLINVKSVNAYDTKKVNSCDGTSCILMCAYTNPSPSTWSTRPHSSYIYYDLNANAFFVEYYTNKTYNYYLDTELGNEYVVFKNETDKQSLKNGKCPSLTYIDTFQLGKPHICLTNSSVCESTGNRVFISENKSTKEKDYLNEVSPWITPFAINILPNYENKCDSLAKNKKLELYDDFMIYLKKNGVYKNGLEKLISISYLNNEINNAFNGNLKALEAYCHQKEDEAAENGDKTQAEAEANKEAISDSISGSENKLDSQLQTPPSSSSGSSNLEKLNGCSSLLEDPNTPGTPAYYLSFAFSIMRYAAIILLIVMTIMDFTGSVAAQDNDVMKKAMGKLSKRAIMLVIIFFLPTVIDLMLKFIHKAQISGCIDLSK